MDNEYTPMQKNRIDLLSIVKSKGAIFSEITNIPREQIKQPIATNT